MTETTAATTQASLVQIKKWSMVAVWSWDVTNDTCAICRTNLNECCIDCTAGGATEVACSIIKGACNHSFHNHCMSRWLRTHATCPLCHASWDTASVEILQ